MFDWDETKRISNLEDHGLDFIRAEEVFNAPSKYTLESHRSHELRWKDLAEVDGKILALVYTYRGDKVRIISYRDASHKERRAYYGSLL